MWTIYSLLLAIRKNRAYNENCRCPPQYGVKGGQRLNSDYHIMEQIVPNHP